MLKNYNVDEALFVLLTHASNAMALFSFLYDKSLSIEEKLDKCALAVDRISDRTKMIVLAHFYLWGGDESVGDWSFDRDYGLYNPDIYESLSEMQQEFREKTARARKMLQNFEDGKYGGIIRKVRPFGGTNQNNTLLLSALKYLNNSLSDEDIDNELGFFSPTSSNFLSFAIRHKLFGEEYDKDKAYDKVDRLLVLASQYGINLDRLRTWVPQEHNEQTIYDYGDRAECQLLVGKDIGDDEYVKLIPQIAQNKIDDDTIYKLFYGDDDDNNINLIIDKVRRIGRKFDDVDEANVVIEQIRKHREDARRFYNMAAAINKDRADELMFWAAHPDFRGLFVKPISNATTRVIIKMMLNNLEIVKQMLLFNDDAIIDSFISSMVKSFDELEENSVIQLILSIINNYKYINESIEWRKLKPETIQVLSKLMATMAFDDVFGKLPISNNQKCFDTVCSMLVKKYGVNNAIKIVLLLTNRIINLLCGMIDENNKLAASFIIRMSYDKINKGISQSIVDFVYEMVLTKPKTYSEIINSLMSELDYETTLSVVGLLAKDENGIKYYETLLDIMADADNKIQSSYKWLMSLDRPIKYLRAVDFIYDYLLQHIGHQARNAVLSVVDNHEYLWQLYKILSNSKYNNVFINMLRKMAKNKPIEDAIVELLGAYGKNPQTMLTPEKEYEIEVGDEDDAIKELMRSID